MNRVDETLSEFREVVDEKVKQEGSISDLRAHDARSNFEDEELRSDLYDEKTLRKSCRSPKPTRKILENFEAAVSEKYWKTADRIKGTIREIEGDLSHATSSETLCKMKKEVEHCKEDLDLVYREVRSSFHGTVPTDIRQTVDRYIQDLDKLAIRVNPERIGSVSRHGSESRYSHLSKSSSISSKKALLVATAASLRAQREAKKIEHDKMLEISQLEVEEKVRRVQFESRMDQLQQKLEDQRLITEISKTEAELRALDEFDEQAPVIKPEFDIRDNEVADFLTGARPKVIKDERQSPVRRIENEKASDMPRDVLPDNRISDIEFHQESPDRASTPNTLDLIRALTDSVNQSRVPAPEPTIFSGDTLNYPMWKASFKALIESRNIPASERIHFLKRYTDGEARAAIEGIFYFDSDDAYDDARAILDERYGNPFLVSEAFRNQLDAWPKISGGDGKSLRKYADFLRQCCIAAKHIPSLQILNDCRENRKMLMKLPDWLVRRWSRIVAEFTDRGEYPPFEKFVTFVLKEADIACNPVMSFKPIRPAEKVEINKLRSSRVPPSARNLAVESNAESSPSKPANNNSSAKTCVFCKRTNHILDSCRQFRSKTALERQQFLKKSGLCFGCLAHGHMSRDCTQKMTCTECNRKHPRCLHGDYEALHSDRTDVENEIEYERRPPSDSISLRASLKSVNSFSSMILPVYVSCEEYPENEYLVYALLDTQSDSTFILDETLDKLKTRTDIVDLKLSTMTDTSVIHCKRAWNLKVRGLTSDKKISLPITYGRNFIPMNREHIPTPEVARKWPHLREMANELAPVQDCDVGLLIGYNCSRALAPKKVLTGNGDQPFAIQTELGWGVVGRVMCEEESISHSILTKPIPSDLQMDDHTRDEIHFVCRTRVTEAKMPEIIKILESDFPERKADEKVMSQDDLKFLKILQQGIHQNPEGFYEMPLPFRDSRPILPNNVDVTRKRLNHLKKRFKSNEKYFEDYKKFMNSILDHGEAEEVPENDEVDRCWYIPHHGVYHPKKPDKIRVVFDCSARCGGDSLNNHLLQGPDLMNSLTGVLCRFREWPIAIIGDLERMFHQFRVNSEDRDYLRFLWWKHGDIDSEPATYRMKVHLFGATSSPGCANFALKKIAADHEEYGSACNFLATNFYVDDGLGSFSSTDEAICLVKDIRNLCSEGNLRLHKFMSNSEAVMQSIPESEHATEMGSYTFDETPIGRVLGMEWCVSADHFQFTFSMPVKPMTRRGLLSTVASVYDPLGCLAPFVLLGKQLLQQLCHENRGWDEELPDSLRPRWERWLTELPKLATLQISRSFIPEGFGRVLSYELHHFSDASFRGYGQCSYLRLTNERNEVFCALVMGKARVVPLKTMTMLRLELTAAVTSMKISIFLRNELTYENISEYYWTDSQVVLGYINNDARRFHVFVANRVQQIRNSSDPCQWRYVPSQENPADYASRGLHADELINSNWLKGPGFLWEKTLSEKWVNTEILPDDPEVKKVVVHTTMSKSTNSLLQRLEVFSEWRHAITAITALLNFISKRKNPNPSLVSRTEGEFEIIRLLQAEAFPEDIEAIKHNRTLPRGSRLYQLDAFLDKNDILRVGGRLSRSSLSYGIKHPIILPKSGHVVNLIIKVSHEATAHQGRGFTINELRSRGYWVIGSSRTVSTYIFRCVMCRKLRGTNLTQKMADLPEDRLEPTPPFTFCGMDCFGPFLVKDGRREVKRYGLIVTCMASRAIHVETLDDMSTDAFINGLRCFIALRGPVQILRSDQGSNFIGAEHELKEAMKELQEDKIRAYLEEHQCRFLMNAPHSSHMGGSWERHIRSIRSVLSSIIYQHQGRFDTSTLRTFLYEAMAIVNSRPLTPQNLNDPHAESLTPNHLLTMKSKLILPPPGNFVKEDVYARKRWRKAQYLADQFWQKWRKEYLACLQPRRKWQHEKRNLIPGDIVILKDEDLVRGHWRLAKVLETLKDEDNLVRPVKLLIGDPNLSNLGKRLTKPVVLERPIHKLTLLLEAQNCPN